MSLINTLRNGVAAVDRVSASLQSTIVHEAWIGSSPASTPSGYPAGGYAGQSPTTAQLAAPITLPAIVEWAAMRVDPKTGAVIQTLAKITIPRAVPANGAPGRTEPFDDRDVITLPNGVIGPIVAIEGLLDPGTGALLMTEMWLGKGGGGL